MNTTILKNNISSILATLFFIGFCQAKTSLSDASSYTQFCRNCIHHKVAFSNFRRAAAYTDIVETVGYLHGLEYLTTLKTLAPHFLLHIHKFKTSDTIGNPITYAYGHIGHIAPTTVRYIKVAFELEQLFGALNGASIVEIGGGYGGQCKIIADLFKFKKYTIIDLPEALGVAKKFLDAHHIKNVTFLTPDQVVADASFDLVISNYAFSECYGNIQNYYIKNIFCKARRGYCICNQICKGDEYHTQEDILNALTNNGINWNIIDEMPLTAPDNYVLVW
jgi:hypothetical protein